MSESKCISIAQKYLFTLRCSQQ